MGWNLLTLPLRLGFAFGLTWLSFTLPWVAAGILGVLFLMGLAGTCVYLWVRWKVRGRSRVTCHQCEYKVLRAAKMCPRCHAPTILGSIAHLDPEARAVALHAAWEILAVEGADADQPWHRALEAEVGAVRAPQSTSVSDPEGVFEVLVEAARTDGVISDAEREALGRWGAQLGVGAWRRRLLMFRR